MQFRASGGLRVVLEGNDLAARHDRDLWLVCSSPAATRTLETAGLWEHFTFADTVPDALNKSS